MRVSWADIALWEGWGGLEDADGELILPWQQGRESGLGWENIKYQRKRQRNSSTNFQLRRLVMGLFFEMARNS